jgi:LPS-assembly protein
LVYLPFASLSLKHQDRASGFLTPTFSASGEKGFRISEAYYLTLGRSADFTLRGDLFFEARHRHRRRFTNARQLAIVFQHGFLCVKDRIFGPSADADHPDQGGSSFYVDAVHYFPNGFLRGGGREHHFEPDVSPDLLGLDPAGDLSGRTLPGFSQQKLQRLQL